MQHAIFGDIQAQSDQSHRAYIPISGEKGQAITFKTPTCKVVSYDESTQVLCVEFSEGKFLKDVTELNDRVHNHVVANKRHIYGKVTDEEISQIYRPFAIGRHVYLYAWDAAFVRKDGTPDPDRGSTADRALAGLPGAQVKMSVSLRGVSLHPSIFGCALEIGHICVFREPVKAHEGGKLPEESAKPEDKLTFSDDEDELDRPLFQGICRSEGGDHSFR